VAEPQVLKLLPLLLLDEPHAALDAALDPRPVDRVVRACPQVFRHRGAELVVDDLVPLEEHRARDHLAAERGEQRDARAPVVELVPDVLEELARLREQPVLVLAQPDVHAVEGAHRVEVVVGRVDLDVGDLRRGRVVVRREGVHAVAHAPGGEREHATELTAAEHAERRAGQDRKY
jgi:hypothetical protein